MKIAVLGAGFTGLTAALRLSKKGHEVTVFEKEKIAGGLASGFKEESWEWPLEKSYHHFFTNDKFAFSLAREVGQGILINRPLTTIYYKPPSSHPERMVSGSRTRVEGSSEAQLYNSLRPRSFTFVQDDKEKDSMFAVLGSKFVHPFDSPLHLLSFHYLSISQKIRTGLVLAFLKLTNDYLPLEKYTAYEWLEKHMGETAFNILFKPLFIGKFRDYADRISMAWFWARIKKRTPSLAYPAGGYQSFIDKLIHAIEKNGGKIFLGTPVNKITHLKSLEFEILNLKFDIIVSTLPTPIFLKLTHNLNIPPHYIKRLTSINHLHALNLILELKEPFFKSNEEGKAMAGGAGGKAPDSAQLFLRALAGGKPATGPAPKSPYWLNINDPSFPFLALVEHTNFMDKKHYNNHRLLYIGNYLPQNHKYFTKSKEELLKIFDPFLKIFNKNYKLYIVNSTLHIGPFAQPIITTNYSKVLPPLETGLKNLYAGNLDNVYPWDRGANYAIELGEKLAETVILIRQLAEKDLAKRIYL